MSPVAAVLRALRVVVALLATLLHSDVMRRAVGFHLPSEPHSGSVAPWYGAYYDYPNGWTPGAPGAVLVAPASPPQWTRHLWSTLVPPRAVAWLVVLLLVGIVILF